MMEPQTSTNISTRLERIARLAKDAPQMAFRALAHHIDIELIREAYRLTRKDGAVGVDGQSAAEYGARLEDNLQSLLNRAKSGTYFAPPVRRVHIPKGNGKETRPLGIPTFEDKVLQRAVAMVVGTVYEQDFLVCSYGFRPGRSAHQLLEGLWNTTMKMGGGWVIEIDIAKYFDTIPHDQLRDVIRQRVIDGVLLRLIGKWLNAGVLEDGELSTPGPGTPQGGVISPLLANIFLHTVLDQWFENEVKPRLDGQARLFRYADDAVLVFANEKDARRVYEVLPKRFGKYGLTLHPDKTRLIEFRRPVRGSNGDGTKGPTTFDLLGFTHFWGKSRSGKARSRSLPTDGSTHQRVVQAASARPATRATGSSRTQADRALRVLWHHWELREPGPFATCHQPCLVQMVAPPLAKDASQLGPIRDTGEAFSASASSDSQASHDQQIRCLKSRMREIRTSGSVGGRRGDSPADPTMYATRQAT